MCNDSDEISCMKAAPLAAVMPVRRRFMNAVFFFSDESRDLLTGKISGSCEELTTPRYESG